MHPRDGQGLEAGLEGLLMQPGEINVELAERGFHAQLPERDAAHEYFVRGVDQASRLGLQLGRVAQRPKQDVRVEQELQLLPRPSNAASVASSSGESKSAGTTNSPFIKPNLIFRFGCSLNGTSLAIGVPDLAITTVSPRPACSTSSERR